MGNRVCYESYHFINILGHSCTDSSHPHPHKKLKDGTVEPLSASASLLLSLLILKWSRQDDGICGGDGKRRESRAGFYYLRFFLIYTENITKKAFMKSPELFLLLLCRREQPQLGACRTFFVYLLNSEAGIQIFQTDR